jgi:hypothetical protein
MGVLCNLYDDIAANPPKRNTINAEMEWRLPVYSGNMPTITAPMPEIAKNMGNNLNAFDLSSNMDAAIINMPSITIDVLNMIDEG